MVRRIDYGQDYNVLLDWWNKREHPPLSPEALGELGFVALDEEERPVAASWLYKTNSSLGLVAWTVADPEVPWQKRRSAIWHVVKTIETVASELGIKALFGFSENDRLTEKMDELGWNVMPKHDFFGKELGGNHG